MARGFTAYGISLTISKEIEVLNSDIVIVVRQDKRKLGTLTLSKGTIDWKPRHKRAGKKGETQLTWSKFSQVMEDANV